LTGILTDVLEEFMQKNLIRIITNLPKKHRIFILYSKSAKIRFQS